MAMRKTVVIGLLGVHKDQPRRGRKAWDDWRPSVALCQQEDLVVDRFELIRQSRYHKLGDQVARDIQVVSPETEVRVHDIVFDDPWDFESVFASLHAFARSYDYVFHAQRSMGEYMRQAGVRGPHWVPLGCSPQHHYPMPKSQSCDIAFAGTTQYGVNWQRINRIQRLQQAFTTEAFNGMVGEDYCRAFSRGRIAFNSSISQDINMRVFEIMAMQIPLLTNRDASANGLDELFEEGVHYAGYDDCPLRPGHYQQLSKCHGPAEQ